ncbi:m-AAA protease-interacting protein 1, mitochondrial [Sander lucioperca]|uniref:Si:dkey-82o10.4 n=1 Tax=Sander lucioperca TaxID=283035 RepID=A0A8C9YGS5_SANLU|nr:m-AAA protease-interacting protein 1, mitochondrial [Sander lucioperca]XP_035862028.1 m-AAA protease-interacting protein 1, mitochondrial [Sander lucioperca]XP_035862029.1 m-AAA protease-interacting protein 1, mitochondrial [Sander lucioperca]
MQRITSHAACRELGGLAACIPGGCSWKRGPACSRQPAVHRQWAWVCVLPARPFTGLPGAQSRRLCRRRFEFAGQKHRLFSSQPGADGPPGSSSGQPAVSVVGIPDPITWIRCKLIMYLIDLYFELDINSVEFERGVKQALVHVSNMMSSGRYHKLVGIMSNEMIDYVQTRCRSLTDAQRRQLAVTMDDIIFIFPEDVSVVFDQYGRKFCFVVMRCWLLSTYEGPDDPEGTKIFKVASSEDGGPQKKIVTAVYEFQRELTTGASPDWTVTTVWHWHWKLAE